MRWVSRALFREQHFDGAIHDPAAGFGNIVVAARAASLEASAADIVDRGFQGAQVRDFLQDSRLYPNVVCNPPYEIIAQFGPHAVTASLARTALVFPVARLNAAAKGWLRGLPLTHVWLITPRPSMPPGDVYQAYLAKGREPSGGRVDFCWLIFERGFQGAPTIGWLARDTSAMRLDPAVALARGGRTRTHADSSAVLTELEATYERARQDVGRRLEERFIGEPGTVTVIVNERGGGAAKDLRGILADDLDWPMERAWRQAKEALR